MALDQAASERETPAPASVLGRIARLVLVMVLAGFAGAWLASLGFYLYDLNVPPEALGDGQYVFRFLQSIPVGWVVGLIAMSLVQAVRKFRPRTALIVTTVGFVMLTPIVTLPLLPIVSISLGLVIYLFGGGS